MKASIQTPHIIFDLDGTLIDSSASILAGFAHAFNTLKIKPHRALTPEVIGPPLMHTLSMLSGSDDAKLLNALAAEFKAHYDNEGYKETVVFPGVAELLDQLAAQPLTLYIATNKRLHPTLKILQHLGWDTYFAKVFALDFYTPALASKKQMVTRILAEEVIPATEALYIGDRYEDGVAADDNAIEFALVTWGYLDGSMGIIPSHWQKYESPASLAKRLMPAASTQHPASRIKSLQTGCHALVLHPPFIRWHPESCRLPRGYRRPSSIDTLA